MTIPDYYKFVWSMRKEAPQAPIGAMRVDRVTGFGNPFIVGVHGEVGTCCNKFKDWLDTGEDFGNKHASVARRHWILANIAYLRDMNLLCWCRSPNDPPTKQCHALELARRANTESV